MGALTEPEIFDRMRTSLRVAADLCGKLAHLPMKGRNYDKLRTELKLIEGCCKQASTWREDARWLPIGRLMAQCHAKAGDWLRGIVVSNPDGTKSRVKINGGTLHPAFVMLGANLAAILKVVDDLKNKPTHRVGMILPAPIKDRSRDTVPVGWRRSGLIIPPGVNVQ
jgi:hypothetical protein